MASKNGKLTKAEIASLLQAAHHEPRSLLGYHEFPRADGQPLAMVRVFEPGAESIAVIWEDDDATWGDHVSDEEYDSATGSSGTER